MFRMVDIVWHAHTYAGPLLLKTTVDTMHRKINWSTLTDSLIIKKLDNTDPAY